MAIPKKRARDWREDWNTDEWWWSWQTLWFVAACASEASAALRDRREFVDGWGAIADHRNLLVTALNAVTDKHGDHSAAGVEARIALEPLIMEADRELWEHRVAHRERAFDRVKLEGVTLQKLLERGMHPKQYARWMRRDLRGDENALHECSERVQAQQERRKLADHHKRQLERYEWSLERVADADSRQRLTTWISDARRVIANLSSACD